MADLLTTEKKGVSNTVSDTPPPTHYTVKLQGFSILKNMRYQTAEFETGGHKWKLTLYPNGNKSKNINDSISVYLMLIESSLPNLWSEVHAFFRVLLFNQNDDNYYILEAARRFHRMKLEWGFDRFMPLSKFNDPSNGYLVHDTCVFGAEIYVKENNNGKGEQFIMMKDVNSYKHTWKIENFSTIASKDNVHDSMPFNCGGQKWKLQLYPKGFGTGIGNHISIYLAFGDSVISTNGSQIYTEFTIRIIDQLHDKNHAYKTDNLFNKSSTTFGWYKFIPLTDLNTSTKGFLVKDCCILEVDVTVHGVTTSL